MRGTNSKYNKIRPTNYIFGVVRRCIWSEKSTPKKAHLWPSPSLHTKFKLPSSIWRRDRGGIDLFQGQKGEKSSYRLS